jgi:hypothetical protein
MTDAINKQIAVWSQSPGLAAERLAQIKKADPEYYARYVYEQRHGRSAPTQDTTEAPPAYQDIVKAVERRAQLDASSLDEAWTWLLKAHPDYGDAHRRWQLYDRPAALAQQERDANPITPLSPAQMKAVVKAMPAPPSKPSMDSMKWKG